MGISDPDDDNTAFPWNSFRAYLRDSSESLQSLHRQQIVDQEKIGRTVDSKVIAATSNAADQEADKSAKIQPARPRSWWQYYLNLERPQNELEPRPAPVNEWWLKYKDEKSTIGTTERSNNLGLWQTIENHEQEKREEEEKIKRRGERWRKIKAVFQHLFFR